MSSSQNSTENLILIIDDSAETIRFLAGMLQDMGKVIFATSGEAGIALAHQQRPQLILLDVEMPAMDGYEVCRRLKSDEEANDCSIIFVTAQTSMESEVKALDAGAVDFITKPLNPPVVRARIRTHLKLQRDARALVQLANRDGLTGLFNRRYFDEQLANEISRHRRQKHPLGLALIDIDFFKAYNDHYGHQAGDDCLRKVAQSLGSSMHRPGEVVARYGGEEFVIILPYATLADAAKDGEWLCEQVRKLHLPHAFSKAADQVTISVGVASLVPEQEEAAHKLIADADHALYEAKASGRNCAKISGQL